MLHDGVEKFVNEMMLRGVSNDDALKAAEAGYVVWPITSGWGDPPKSMVMDCHYGLKTSGLFELDEFAGYLKGETSPVPPGSGVEIYKNVRDLQDLQEIASRPRHQQYIARGFTSFRGQTRDYWAPRTVPNPRICDDQKRERIIAPSYWRTYLDKPFSGRNWGPSGSIFQTMLADPLVYHGIPNWRTLSERNYERYGFHSMSDLEDFPDPDSQEYFRRWSRHKVMPGTEYPLIEQHYGQNTIGLDVTFDLATAAFFASHRWSTIPGTERATYKAASPGQHKGVIYFLTFRDPRVRKTDYLVQELGVFQHLPVVRPIRQQCGLPAFHANEIAAATRDLDAVLYLDENFSTGGLPEAPYLFPIGDDPFYQGLMEQKQRSRGPWDWVVEYEF